MPKLTTVSSKGSAVSFVTKSTGRTVTIADGTSSFRLARRELEELQGVLDQMRGSGYLSYNIEDDEDQGLSPTAADHVDDLVDSAVARLVSLGAPAAKSTNSVHAALAGNAVPAFPGPFTSPAVPRNLRCVFAASYDGGDVTVTGTDQFDAVITELFTAVAASTVVGVKIFKTVVSALRSATGATANTVSIGTGDKLGVPFTLADEVAQLYVDGTAEAVTADATYSGITPTTVPNASHVYTLLANF